jgi:hypothetical protein
MKIKKKCILTIVQAVHTNFRSNSKYLMGKNDESHFVFLIFTLRASRRLPCPAGCAYSAFVIKGLQ